MTIYRGHLIHVTGSPTARGAAAALVSEPDGALAVGRRRPDRVLRRLGRRARRRSPATTWCETGACLLPGFVDTHVHFPQTFTTDAFGGGELLEWLERCVFPAESRLSDPAFADVVAAEFVRRRDRRGHDIRPRLRIGVPRRPGRALRPHPRRPGCAS